MKTSHLHLLLYYLILLQSFVTSHKFLLYNPVNLGASPSHRLFIDKLGNLLVDNGHDVVNYMPTLLEHDEGKNKRKGRLLEWKGEKMLMAKDTTFSNAWLKDDSFWGMFNITTMLAYSDKFGQLCDAQMADSKLMDQLKSENFDLGLSENFDPCGFAIFKRLGIKYAPVFSTTPSNFQFESWCIPSPQSYVPAWIWPYANPANFKKRLLAELSEVYSYNYAKYIHHSRIVDRQGYGDYSSILAESQVIFVNADEFVDFTRPITNKIIYIGGFGLEKAEHAPVDQEIKKVLDNSKKTVLISFGALVNSSAIPSKPKNSFLKAFKHFPDVTFIWRYQTPNDGFGKEVKNLHLGSWLPQHQILSHKTTVGFVSHCGMNSMSEANYFGVPMICVPFFGDQHRNVKSLIQREIGLELSKHSVNEEKLVQVLQKLIDNDSYYKSAKTLSKLIKAKPLTATDRFVKYAELAAEFDLHSYWDIPGRNLSSIQYYNLDVKAFLLLLITSFVFTFYKILSFLFGLCRPSKKVKQQ
ncbi:unnamed protein product [Bursaphelenchus okinawaensis]|uniref:glucuronosyltransferase n=1 Tax=Bursaphelenchus okinawaensis TaxID=465554 RepID=A0A811LH09_9BILA|nr:unnamed protein product [Bursaphelenchus okinawaensis]CAG9123652.1 unnamed protein product [Bursaphelenchus okinawaensis]